MEHQYNKSKYMYCTKLENSENYLCYSFRTKRFVILDPFQKLIFDQAPFDDISSRFLKGLYEAGFLVEGDEYEFLIERQKREYRRIIVFTLLYARQ